MVVKRIDGRSKGTMRPLVCELSSLNRADGSSLWKSGSTHILAGVFGPISPQNMNNEEDVAAHISVVIKSGVEHLKFNNEMEKFLTDILSSCIDVSLFPRCVIELVLQIVQSDGSLLSCLLHAAVAALMDAGVDLLYLPVATTCLVRTPIDSEEPKSGRNKNSVIWLDPTSAEEEEERDSSILVLVNEQRQPDKILGSHTVGSGISLNDFLACIQIAQNACAAVPSFWRLAIEQKLNRESMTLYSR